LKRLLFCRPHKRNQGRRKFRKPSVIQNWKHHDLPFAKQIIAFWSKYQQIVFWLGRHSVCIKTIIRPGVFRIDRSIVDVGKKGETKIANLQQIWRSSCQVGPREWTAQSTDHNINWRQLQKKETSKLLLLLHHHWLISN